MSSQVGKGAQLIAGAVPAGTGVRAGLGDCAGGREAERGPVEGDALAEGAGRVVDDDVAGVGIPGGPGGGVGEPGPDGPGGRVDDDGVVREQVGVAGIEAVRPVNIDRALDEVVMDDAHDYLLRLVNGAAPVGGGP